ncbi:MAG: hypothetical protein GY817_03500 [bacterium]|nr:hypothetical protein [bacterium]
MKNIKILLICFLLVFLNLNVFASLRDDKDEILKQSDDYIQEDAEEPVLRELYSAALDAYRDNDFENAIFYFQKILDIREMYHNTSFLIEAIEKMLNYPVYEAKEIIIGEYIDRGREYYEHRKYLAALNIWEKILILQPINKDVVTEYVNDCRRLLADPYYERGWYYFKEKKYLEAVDQWEYVLGLVPNYKGLESLLRKTQEKANEKKVLALIGKAKKNYDLDKMKKALSLIKEALSINAKNDEAKVFKKRIIKKMKRQYERYFNLGLEFYNMEKYQDAISKFSTSLKYNLTVRQEDKSRKYISKARHELAKLNIEEEDDFVVEERVEEKVETEQVIDKEQVRKHYTQGLYYYRNGYIKKAIAEWEIVANLDPQNERAYTSLQRAKADLNKK